MAKFLALRGFPNVKDMKAGFPGWVEAGYPVDK
jgi:rhodanese-related sulfurtransferase